MFIISRNNPRSATPFLDNAVIIPFLGFAIGAMVYLSRVSWVRDDCELFCRIRIIRSDDSEKNWGLPLKYFEVLRVMKWVKRVAYGLHENRRKNDSGYVYTWGLPT